MRTEMQKKEVDIRIEKQVSKFTIGQKCFILLFELSIFWQDTLCSN